MKKFRILALDGGGIRGIISAIWLRAITEQTGLPPHECFDLIIGTSTGSITAAVAALGLDLDRSIKLYEKSGPRIFTAAQRRRKRYTLSRLFSPMYSDTRLQDVLYELFGDTKLSAARTRLLIPAYNAFGRNIALMRSYQEQYLDAPVVGTQDRDVWEACKASSSAPTYFPAHMMGGEPNEQHPYVDGGMFANNPALLGLSEAVRILPGTSVFEVSKSHDIVVVSLGSGHLTRRIKDRQALGWGQFGWASPAIDVLMDSSSDIAHICAANILPDESYVRMQLELIGASDDMDDASADNIRNLARLAQIHLMSDHGKQQIQRIVNLVQPTELNPAWRDNW